MDGCDPLDHIPAGERQQERWQLLPDERRVHDTAVRHRAHDPGSSPGDEWQAPVGVKLLVSK